MPPASTCVLFFVSRACVSCCNSPPPLLCHAKVIVVQWASGSRGQVGHSYVMCKGGGGEREREHWLVSPTPYPAPLPPFIYGAACFRSLRETASIKVGGAGTA